jgi:hypothetical protein
MWQLPNAFCYPNWHCSQRGLLCLTSTVCGTALCPVIPIWNGYQVPGIDETTSPPRLAGTELQYSCHAIYDEETAAAYGKTTGTIRYQFVDADPGLKTSYCVNGEWIPPIVQCLGIPYTVTSSHDYYFLS